MSSTTRRRFLQRSVAAAAAASLTKTSPLWSQAGASPGPVKAWITSDTQKYAPAEAPKWTAAIENSESVRIDPTTWYQEILGFGGAFTDASCYQFYQLNAQDRRALFNEL